MIGLDDAYRRIRPLLFKLNPETAHFIALTLVKFGSVFEEFPTHAGAPIQLAGISFPNPVGLAAGLDKNARAIVGLTKLGFGFIEVGAATPKPQTGNPKPRLFRLEEDEAVINRLGFNNIGVRKIARRVSQARLRVNIPIGVNIGKNRSTPNEDALGDYLACCDALFDAADFLSVNLSSPNTPGLRELQTRSRSSDLLCGIVQHCQELAVQRTRKTPVFVKVSPDLIRQDLVALVETIASSGCDGIVATNTTTRREGLKNSHQAEAGGLSGKPLNSLACDTVRAVREVVGDSFPIIGVGGVFDRDSMCRMLDAGAHVVQIYTGLIFRGPGLVSDLAKL